MAERFKKFIQIDFTDQPMKRFAEYELRRERDFIVVFDEDSEHWFNAANVSYVHVDNVRWWGFM